MEGFDLTPMIDIVFLLIIFFMVSSTFIKSRGIKVKLPGASSAQSEKSNQLVVTIKKDGEVYLNDVPVQIRSLEKKLRQEREKTPENTLIIRGDRSVPYEKMIEIMDIAKIAGLEKISLATTRRR